MKVCKESYRIVGVGLVYKESENEGVKIDVSEYCHEEHTVTSVQHTTMTGNKPAEVFRPAGAFEATAEKSSHRTKSTKKNLN